MASGHRTITGKHPQDAELEQQLAALCSDPKFENALRAYDREDGAHDVAYLAGSESDGKTIDFDRHFVAAIEAGKVQLNGQPYDPRPYIRCHEAIEGAILRHQYDPATWHLPEPHYDVAHRIALIGERHAVEHALGNVWPAYIKSTEPFIKQEEHEEIKDPPAHILREPYVGTPLYERMQARARQDAVEGEPNMMPSRGYQSGARLTTAKRKALPTSTFALPGRRYPINDPNHARNALARVAQHGSSEEQSRVRAAVHRKYPGIGQHGAREPGAEGERAQAYGMVKERLVREPVRDNGGHQQGARRGVFPKAGAKGFAPHFTSPKLGGKGITQYGARADEPSASSVWWERYAPGRASERAYGPADYTGTQPRPPAPQPQQGGARHGDEREDKALIRRMLAEHERERNDHAHQQGARMPQIAPAPMANLGDLNPMAGGGLGNRGNLGGMFQAGQTLGGMMPALPRSTNMLPQEQPAQMPGTQLPGARKGKEHMHAQWGARGFMHGMTSGGQYGARDLTASSGATPGGQYGARMPPHMHALTIASATHLHRAGHLTKPEMAAIHAKARSAMPPRMAPPSPMGVGGMPMGGGQPTFGSLDIGGGPMQMQ